MKTLAQIFEELPAHIKQACPERVIIVSLFSDTETADQASLYRFNISQESALQTFRDLLASELNKEGTRH